MDEREKHRAEIESKMTEFGETLNKVVSRLENRNETPPDIPLAAALEKYEKAKTKIKEMDQTDEPGWQKKKNELNYLFNDIDDDLRQALAYFD